MMIHQMICDVCRDVIGEGSNSETYLRVALKQAGKLKEVQFNKKQLDVCSRCTLKPVDRLKYERAVEWRT